MIDDENIMLEYAKDNKVVKDNLLIQEFICNKKKLSVTEKKIICYILSMIHPDYPDERFYSIDIRIFCKLAGFNYNSGGNYDRIKKALGNIASNGFWFKDKRLNKLVCFQWICSPVINLNSGTVDVEIPQTSMTYLVNMNKNFTSYQYRLILPLKSKYSINLYELLLSYFFQKIHVFELDELKILIDCKITDYRNFRRIALEVAVKEINMNTDLRVTWEPITKGRKVIQIRFIMLRRVRY